MKNSILGKNFPTVIVVLGATGDLMGRKIVPALYNLHSKGKLPALTHIVGFSRRDIDTAGFRKMVETALPDHKKAESFLKLFSYQKRSFGDVEAYRSLGKTLGVIDGEWRTCANKLFYLAVPPDNYETIFHQLAETGLTLPCGPDEGWTRVLVEKPFGHDAHGARKLDMLLGKLFKEEQIYRIDHYLAKEMLQNIINFRFNNNLLEKSWDRHSIERVEIRLWEKIGVEKRGKFYDGVGALRDVGQNHLLQMLALITMEEPLALNAVEIRKRRAEVLTFLKPPKDVVKDTYRAQYSGYRGIKDVDPKSDTETYFKTRQYLKNERWEGVPFILESGKRMGEVRKEIIVKYRNSRNIVKFILEPHEKITISFFSKKPGLDHEVEQRELDFSLRVADGGKQYVEEYEKLLLDAILGDQTLFVATAEVKEMWRVTDPVIAAWKKGMVPLKKYSPDSSSPSSDSALVSRRDGDHSESLKKIAVVGLGKMGANIARRLKHKGWRVIGYNRTREVTNSLTPAGIEAAYSYKELAKRLPSPRVVWVMLPAGDAIEDAIFGKEGLIKYLSSGDTIIDGSNSNFKDTAKRYRKAMGKGIGYLDVGVSGGPSGALNGACLMIGGRRDLYEKLKYLFVDLETVGGTQYLGKSGAGHFAKMVHNGIEYGMMQAIAEGFAVLKKSAYKYNLRRLAKIYNNGSVIESRLIGWLKSAFMKYGDDLEDITSTVAATGEGKWTVEAARTLKVETKIIKDSVDFRKQSSKKPSYVGKILSALRHEFGGHKA